MGHYFVTRHGVYINMLFMDYTIKKVDIRTLWGLKWNRLSNPMTTMPEGFFPVWIQKL
jgi:hypothetical protein